MALVGAGFLQVGVGTELICSTIIIGALSNISNENELLVMNNKQMSWFGESDMFINKYVFTTSFTVPTAMHTPEIDGCSEFNSRPTFARIFQRTRLNG